jgi:aspartate aminotransferase
MQYVVRNLQNVTVSISTYQSKRDFLFENLTEMGYSMVKPQGTFYMFPKSPLKDEISFVKELQQHNILVVPGRSFGTPGYFRISYCVHDKTLEGSLDGFKKAAIKHNLR